MRQKTAQVVGRKVCLDDHVGEHYLQTETGNPPAKFVIVGKKIDDGLEPADALQISPPESQR
jgi:hypothetical protein